MELRNYQENAIKEILEKSKEFLQKNRPKTIVFQSPTGSGKTIMIAELLKRLCSLSEFKDSLSFIWTAPRKLHEQSKDKLSSYYQETRDLECSNFEDLQDRKINFNEVLFFNWESINKKDNIYIRENERDNNLSAVIERTKKIRKIVLIIDESHHGATSTISKNLIKDMSPDLTINVSATPPKINHDYIKKVDIEDVKNEGMIKQTAVLNDGFKNEREGNNIFSNLKESSDLIVLKESLKKRGFLLKLYKKKDLNINPLLLIQLPDSTSPQNDSYKDKVKKLLSECGVTIENGKLGIYLSEDKQNLDKITKSDSEVDVLIFKQAIALGWDCPRSQILTLFREWSSPTFSIQTLGRIMRVADINQEVYTQNFDPLNHAYVFTNLPEIKLDDELSQMYTAIYKSERKSIYKSLRLSSWHRVRHREKTRFSSLFLEIFEEEAVSYGLKEKVKLENQAVKGQAISETTLQDPKEISDVSGDLVHIENEEELEKNFDSFVEEVLKEEPSFFPEERSIGYLKQAIYDFFQLGFELDIGENYSKIIKVILGQDNIGHFKEVIRKSKESYEKKVKEREEERKENTWEVPEIINYNGEYEEGDVQKSIMKPFYRRENSSPPEKEFINYLEEKDSVEWWFKNGEKEAKFFAIPYEENGRQKLFYIDFIVKLKNGKIGLLDTKGKGSTAINAKEKVKGLKKYIDSLNKPHIFGGIIIFENNYWKIYHEEDQDYDVNNPNNWEPLNI